METSSRIFQTVIVGVDFSRYSRLVVRQAERLAREFKAKLVLVHAAFEPLQIAGPDGYPIPLVFPVKIQELAHSVRSFYHLHKGSHVIVQKGYPAEVLARVADKLNRPLVVIGSSARYSLSRFFIGSHAEEIALTSKYPVWVHRGIKVVQPHHILVPIDLSVTARKLAAVFKRWSQEMQLSFSYLLVRPEAPIVSDYPAYRITYEKMTKGVREALARFQTEQPKLKVTTVTGDPAQKICDRGRRFDLIALTPRARKGKRSFFSFGRVTAKVIRQSEVPILVMRPVAAMAAA